MVDSLVELLFQGGKPGDGLQASRQGIGQPGEQLRGNRVADGHPLVVIKGVGGPPFVIELVILMAMAGKDSIGRSS